MEKYYTLNEVALMSGLTTRTLRNHITMGVLKGEKNDGVWRFSVEELEEFFQNPYVKPSIKAKKKSIVFDFLKQNKKQTNEMCTIIDINANLTNAQKISTLFCEQISKLDGVNIQFSSETFHSCVRIILKGPEGVVMGILNSYYSKEW